MDRSEWTARTDNIVVVDRDTNTLTWIPRDLWSPTLRNRVNVAFQRGSHAMLLAAVADHGFGATESLCLLRDAVALALREIAVEVPVEEHLRFWYPMQPDLEIEDGRKLVEFHPPGETLSGERIHQWLGARYAVEGPSSDLYRIRRQQTFVRRLLEDGFDFGRALVDPELISITSARVWDDLRLVRADWHFAVVDDVVPRKIDGMAVLVRRGHEPSPDVGDAHVAH
jgi:anionic cell wall polymer biosynthesis LytR-Cps2A-Psr (LCP) family protein